MSETIYYKTITISTSDFVAIEMAIRKEIGYLERWLAESHEFAMGRDINVRRLFDLRVALVEFSA
ncbi:hypothetical protein BA896_023340 [Janthinobacterium lividum]|uniref:Uncharacterized protein n=1 Tax=Janthinobacterium lividum TaxID=29581 RepID=A0A1E8PN24_9BURK|nr:hypothetical protein BA896_023340 [Janthinobacterium lividum]